LGLEQGMDKVNLLRSFNNWHRYRTTVNELNRLSSYELQDVGIHLGEVRSVARKACRRAM